MNEPRPPTPLDRDPNKHSGDLCIARTRVPASIFVHHLQRGGTIHTFSDEYGVDVTDLKQVLSFIRTDMDSDAQIVDRARTWMRERLAERERDSGMALA